MNPTLKKVLIIIGAFILVLASIYIGAMINMSIINISDKIIPLPPGVDPTDIESIKENIGSFSPKQFIMPFLAHAIGTLVGAFLAVKCVVLLKLTKVFQIIAALLVVLVFLYGGIEMVRMLPETPTWFIAADLLLAYLPMGWLGYKLAGGK